MKKLLVLALALIMALAATSAVFAEEDARDPYFGRFDETVTIRVVRDAADEPGVWTWEDNEWTRVWLERFNIKIELMWNTGTTEEYNTKFAMAMATGDLPDFMKLNAKQYKELLDGGYLMDITELYENNLYPYIKEATIEPQGENVMACGVADGRRYAIPQAALGTNTREVYIRRDYREQVGADIPETIEELIDLGKTFVDEGLCKYALPLISKVTGEGYSDMQAVANAFGAYPGVWLKDAEGKFFYSPTTEAMKTTLDVYKDLFDEGYISQTFATDVSDNLTAQITNGEIGIILADAWFVSWPLPLTDEDNNIIEWDVLNIMPSETNDDFHVQGTGSLTGVQYLCINANCENPEAIMTLFNHTCSALTDPALEELDTLHTVKYDDGTEVQTHMRNPLRIYFSTPNINMMCAVAVEAGLNGDIDAVNNQPQAPSYFEKVNAYLAAVEAGDKAGMKNNYGNYNYFGGKGSVYYNFYEYLLEGKYIWDARTELTTSNYDRLWGSLNQYENTFYVNYICGTESTTFEEFVEEWYGMGGQLLTDELNGN